MTAKNIYYLRKDSNGIYHSERRAVIYQNDTYIYAKIPGSDLLDYECVAYIYDDVLLDNPIPNRYYRNKISKEHLAYINNKSSLAVLKKELDLVKNRKHTALRELASADQRIAELEGLISKKESKEVNNAD